MIDHEDRELLMTWSVRWGVRAVGVVVAILGSAITLGLAYRVFDIVKG
jgi:hypothetical protein